MRRARFSMCRIAAVACTLAMACAAWAVEPSPRLAALLEKLPAESPAIRTELLTLDAADIHTLCEQLVEPGAADDSRARFALHGLAMAVADPGHDAERETFAQTLASVLEAKAVPRDPAFVIEQLQLVNGPLASAALAQALMNERTCSDAARALESLGGETATQAFRAALAQAQGECRIAVINALGALGDSQSVPALAKDVCSDNRELRLAALYALAHSGDPRALDALQQATQAESWYERSIATDCLVIYGIRLAETRHAGEAGRVLRRLFAKRTDPADTHVRCAALEGLARALGVDAVEDVLPALTDENPQVRAAATNVAVALPGTAVTDALVTAFARATPSGRTAILNVLERRGDARASRLSLEALKDAEKSVRMAAIAAAPALGRDEATQPLIRALEATEDDERNATRDQLIRVRGERTTALLKDALPGASPAVRAVLLDILASRPPTGSLDSVFAAAKDADLAVRTAALRALGVLADDSALPALLALLTKADDDDERSAAEQAVAAVAKRCTDREQPAAIVASLDTSAVPARAAVLRVLGRLGGKAALSALRAALNDGQAEIREAALRGFSEWPDGKPAALLLEFAQHTDDMKLHVLALRAYVRMVELDPARSAADLLTAYGGALEAARRPDEKKLVLGRLADVKAAESIAILEPFLADRELAAESAAALVSVADGLVPQRCDVARTALEKVLAINPSAELRQRAEQALQHVEEFEGYITDWWVAGPYEQDGRKGHEIFDAAFAAEDPNASGVAWQRYRAEQGAHAGWAADLAKFLGGDNRAAYLRARVHSPKQQEARLDLGSDDGIKVWLNGEVVHANNALRGMKAGDDRVPVTLHEGWNTLLLKVTSDSGGWAACARVRAPDGSRLPEVYPEAGDRP